MEGGCGRGGEAELGSGGGGTAVKTGAKEAAGIDGQGADVAVEELEDWGEDVSAVDGGAKVGGV